MSDNCPVCGCDLSTEGLRIVPIGQEPSSLAAMPGSAAAFATELTELTNKHIELGLTPEKAASVFSFAADSALGCLKWEPAKMRALHFNICLTVSTWNCFWWGLHSTT